MSIPSKIKSQEIRRLIRSYQARLDYNLCEVGQERLRWWLKNGHKFNSVRAALMTWNDRQVEAYWHDQSLPSPPYVALKPSKEKLAKAAHLRKQRDKLSHAVKKLRVKREEALKKYRKAVKAFDKQQGRVGRLSRDIFLATRRQPAGYRDRVAKLPKDAIIVQRTWHEDV